jgi:hypothetical protein
VGVKSKGADKGKETHGFISVDEDEDQVRISMYVRLFQGESADVSLSPSFHRL